LLAVSHDRFQARWSLRQATLEQGYRLASADPGRSHLVLRAFCLGKDAPPDALSGKWSDFAVDGPNGSGYFDLPYPAARVGASLGLKNELGRFSPLLRGDPVSLPAAPPPPEPPVPGRAAESRPEPAMGEAGVADRIAALRGLPDELKGSLGRSPGGTAGRSVSLDESAVMSAVGRALAANPNPEIPAVKTMFNGTPPPAPGASELLASQWEALWAEGAPIEVRAELILTGRLAAGTKLLLGHEVVTPSGGGHFFWKRVLNGFDQAWPLVQAGLSTPVVEAEPALRFFREAAGAEPLLEIQASLEIEGRVADPGYRARLPEGLRPDEAGVFKLTRPLPHGAVVLPGLSLVAGH
jgi:hypothetical protein